MKKPLAIILLIIGGAAAGFVLIIGCMLLGLVTYDIYGFICPTVITLLATFGVDRLRILYRKKYDLKAPLFYLCAYFSEAVWAVCSLAATIKRLHSGYDWWFAGLAEWYDRVFVPVETAELLAGALLWLGITTIINQYRKAKRNESEN